MYEVSDYDHLAAKVDALTQKFEKLNVNAVTPSTTSPPCEICGVFGHIGVDCQLGSAINGIEQMNYAQYNQGTRPNQFFYKNPQSSYGQVAPPGYTNNQRVAQKSSLEILLENCMLNQNKQLQELKNQTGFLNDSLSKLNTKVDSIATHTKMLETQISQVAQQVATSSQTPGFFPGQTETNPKAHVNAISLGGSKLEETVAKAKSAKGESVKLLGEKDVIESEKPLDRNKALSPLRLVKLNLEAQFNKFLNILKKICIKIPLAEALSRMPLYAKFLKEIFSKKKVIEHNETIALTRESIAIIKKPPPKLRYPVSFAIPCMIGSETFDRALCDLADRSNIQPVGYVEDIPVKVEGIYIPTNYMVLDIDEDNECPIILGRPFLATAGTIVDVKNGMIVFQVSDEMIGFELENFMKCPALYSCNMIKGHDVKERSLASSTQYDLFDPF
ncbi:hypothetical protein MTR_8g463500 [Medicago truncatula]|uniref:Transcription factor interactor and regulator CCHC(Zn) family n=1 Tax=Medicago truncatula TaxID=3880 RepID=A0A072U161_MEDTR|nr:hypothetical protein MTR_8g463500 [Medicago truncatula]